MNNTLSELASKIDSYFVYRYGPGHFTALNIVQSVILDPDLNWVYKESGAIDAIIELVKHDRYVKYSDDQISRMKSELELAFKDHNK